MADVLQAASDPPTNPRGIPRAPFVDRVEDYVTSRSEVETTINSFKEMISKYQFMQSNTTRRASGLREKIPDITKTLQTVRFLSAARGKESVERLETTFELNDTLFARAEVDVKGVGEVFLWLGANVMLAYPLDEAEELLQSKLSTARYSLGTCEEDLDFLREQITTLEVAFARVYNWDVAQRRKEREDGVEGEKKAVEG
ncbi:prefoldin subunit 3 [Dothidotthia symphoricarpi CBS 119687]|uniref:Prefoldin subunit 3 n=1 Tax=Dothidotthia symphoricarpi CBS 119687 TaxID=1392245 RepID=A0A6A6AFW0_9PLEO|nr:prefoldin subunit 3 [Dothidotthia symphoricarpi CBS 119687]KAF2129824.1 prefoldin subunit 3 [Dothidotthia symphoricarpi CBS 119687]